MSEAYVWRSNGAMTRLHAIPADKVPAGEVPHLAWETPWHACSRVLTANGGTWAHLEFMALNDYTGLPKCKRCTAAIERGVS